MSAPTPLDEPPFTTTVKPLAALHPHPRNPRRITQARLEQLARSLAADPKLLDAHPVIARPDGLVLAGHQRVRAAELLGWSEIPVRVVDVDDETAQRWVVTLNAHAGEWDDDQLAGLLAEMDAETVDLTGLADAEVSRLLDSLEPPAGVDPDDAPELPVEPESRLGEVYELGAHRLMCGDSTLAEHVARLVDGETCDAVFMDPPYAIYGSSSGLSASVTDDSIVRPFFRDALASAQSVTKLFGHVYVCCDWRSWPSWWDVAKLTRLEPKNLLVWDKGSSGMGNNWANTYELIGFFVHMPKQKTMTGARKTGQRAVLSPNVIRANRPVGDERKHNAAKPIDLIQHIVGFATDPGQLVLDLFGGSGSTLVAAHQSGRRALIMEKDPAYCDVIRNRYAALAGAPHAAA